MAFSNFEYPDVFAKLGLTEVSTPNMFRDVPPVPASAVLRGSLAIGQSLGGTARTEASRTIWLAGPVLADLWSRYDGRLNLIAGAEFNADPENGLNGYCDFLIGRGPQLPHIAAPLAVIFEAKKGEIIDGFGQCVAGMVGIQRYNRREGREVDPIYGCSTTGNQWRFLALSGTTVTLDLTEYGIAEVDRILGILTHIVGPVPTRSAA